MKQEQRLVAEVYRFLAPFMDTTKRIYVSLDGQAAEMGVQQGILQHPTIPDLWFNFVGAQSPTLIEAKIVHDGKLLVMQSQLQAWRSVGTGAHRPIAWIAATKSFDRFFFWTHNDFLLRLDTTRAKTPTVPLRLPDKYHEFQHPNELALQIIQNSELYTASNSPSPSGCQLASCGLSH